MSIPQAKQMRRAYGFDEVAIVPGDVTINPAMIEISFRIDQLEFELPIMAASMDAVVDAKFAASFSKMGGLAVLNLEGVQTRYEDPEEILEEIAAAAPAEATTLLGLLHPQHRTPGFRFRRHAILATNAPNVRFLPVASALPLRADVRAPTANGCF